MFESLLIANRGEIARRVIRTCRRLGIRTIAVYSEADADALFVREADQAIAIGPAPAAQSYMNADAVIAAARESGAAALHPGYGFLSENADFAEACTAAGIAFVGPPADAIRAMGSKSAAKALMEKAGVSLLPGHHGAAQDAKTLGAAARKIGYPVLIKPSAGGGGRGMRLVEKAGELDGALAAAKREAKSTFGDDHVLIEKYLARPRHVEVQVFADAHGNCIHLFERDCSVQRRHQKIIEEAPAPGLSPELRMAMGEAAVAAAKAVGYRGAGTVEFLLDSDGGFYFMEMNTRLQVEHPVTEMITGLDLVEWQLRVAAGEKLPLAQDDVRINGHAIEVRIYAEDPSEDFRPAPGRITHLRWPPESGHVRIDTGVQSGDTVTAHYDPMIAKLIMWDRDRPAALDRLRGALRETQIAGPVVNVPFLLAVARHAKFGAGPVDTGFVEREQDAFSADVTADATRAAGIAARAVVRDWNGAARDRAKAGNDPHSPWAQASGWRLNGSAWHEVQLRNGEETVTVGVYDAREIGGSPPDITFRLRGETISATVVRDDDLLTVFHDGQTRRLSLFDELAEAEAHAGEGTAEVPVAPMPGVVVAVMVAAGAEVSRGDALLVVEAMKVEHTIRAPVDGTVDEVLYAVGDAVGCWSRSRQKIPKSWFLAAGRARMIRSANKELEKGRHARKQNS
jgi:3-methylcrotonyl-CoA carboxylase alpha subunit